MNIISTMARFLASLSIHNTQWTNNFKHQRSYQTSTKRITGHAKINRAVKKRRARK
ncbi:MULTISPECIES: hypothetical protein [unclassified Providencia]|uniref:hypothetical protein n=1 Tax=unclassified Providencia TaxID=2633465 RepID=UPI002349EED1|nr:MULTISPECIES: hypothetical protein [unclassified Providencia]